METDEFEISLSRELAVCASKIRKLREALSHLERKHGCSTRDVVVSGAPGMLTLSAEERAHWLEQSEALRRWEERRDEFERLYRHFKGERGTP
jgi:hypothetical protein